MKKENHFPTMRTETRTIYFDMDGTIADLYSIEDWLPKLRAEDSSPYREAEPIGDLLEICELLQIWKLLGGKIGIISWCSKVASSEYDKAVRLAKREWLKEFMPVKFDEIHIVKYGTPKDYVAKDKNGILFDDEMPNCNRWRGLAYNPKEISIAEILKELIEG